MEGTRRSADAMRDHFQDKLNTWMTAAERRYLADLRIQEITPALRALSSSYVERRSHGDGKRVHGALDTAGKRAAFALYYAPLHFIAVSEAVHALNLTNPAPKTIVDLGCGTGAAGAAWSLAAGCAPTVVGIDRHPWAVSEARIPILSSLRMTENPSESVSTMKARIPLCFNSGLVCEIVTSGRSP